MPAPLSPEDLETPPCAGCGGTAFTVLHQRGGDLHAEEAFVATTDAFSGYGRVVTCTTCGLVRLSPRQKWSFLEKAYADSEDPLYLEEYDGRLATSRSLLKLCEKHVHPGRMLDLGCGPGIFLDAAKGRNWETHGVEPSRWSVREAHRRGHGTVLEGTFERTNYPDGHFDLVTLNDVIEHLNDPHSLFKEVRRILKPGGVVMIYTPDIDAKVARIMGKWWWGLRPAHLYYFSERTLTALLKGEGMRVVHSSHHGRTFTFGYWITRMRGYAPPLVEAASWLATKTRIGKIPLPLNTFDSIVMLAVKP